MSISPTTSPTSTVVLVRHAETEANVQAVWHGSLDAPLTPRGQVQVAALAQRFPALAAELGGIDALFTSPLPRAQATAAAIGAAIGVTPLVEPSLREFDLGDWEGRSFADLAATENLWGVWETDPTFAPPNGESPASFGLRAVAAAQALVAAHPGQTIVLVTHGGFICNVLAAWLGAGFADWRRWEVHNCSISIVQRTDPGEAWTQIILNDTRHLPAEALSQHDTSAYNSRGRELLEP